MLGLACGKQCMDIPLQLEERYELINIVSPSILLTIGEISGKWAGMYMCVSSMEFPLVSMTLRLDFGMV